MTRWTRLTEGPLALAALAFLVAYATPILDPGLPAGPRLACTVVVALTWVAFGVDVVVRLALSEQRWRYLRRHWFDVAAVALPLLRPLQLLRLVVLLRVLNRGAVRGLRGRVSVYVAGGSVLMWFCGALAVLDAERGRPGANIQSFGDAAWWAVTTMTTVGYGDTYPVTDQGRLAASVLMVGGVALLGAVTATLASWLVERVRSDARKTDDLVAEVRRLSALVERLQPLVEPAPSVGSAERAGPTGRGAPG